MQMAAGMVGRTAGVSAEPRAATSVNERAENLVGCLAVVTAGSKVAPRVERSVADSAAVRADLKAAWMAVLMVVL